MLFYCILFFMNIENIQAVWDMIPSGFVFLATLVVGYYFVKVPVTRWVIGLVVGFILVYLG